MNINSYLVLSLLSRSVFFLLACALMSIVFLLPSLFASGYYMLLPLLAIFPMMLAITGMEILPPSIRKNLSRKGEAVVA